MTARQTASLGGAVGLIVSGTVLALLWFFGVWSILRIGNTDLRVLIWPSSVMLTAGWCCTIPGVLITISSVVINCLLYILIALGLRACIRLTRTAT